MTEAGGIDNLLEEERRYPPPPGFAAQANAKPDIYDRDFEAFWEEEGRERVTWFEPFEQVLEWEPPDAKWYVGGKLNVTYNCVDRHVEAGRGEKVAYHWEGEPEGERRDVTFADLQRETTKLANALKALGVGKGTPVGIYMGMVPETAIAMLACARIGAPHTVVFGGFSSDSLAGRLDDMGCELLITQDEAYRRGQTVPLKRTADEALASAPTVKKAIVLRRTGNEVPMQEGRDVWWHDAATDESDCPCEPMDAGGSALPPLHERHDREAEGDRPHDRRLPGRRRDDAPLHLRRQARLRVLVRGRRRLGDGAQLHRVRAPLQRHDRRHVRGHARLPDKDRWWAIVERYGVTILYTAPTAIRAHMKWGPEYAEQHDLSSLRLLGSVGEPINPEAWVWYHEHIGGGRCPIVDTWWQTETGMILITPLPGVTTLKPGSATKPFPGVDAAVYDESGNEVGPGGGGYLVLRRPWPAMLRGIYRDPGRYRETFWSRFPDTYFAGDGARIDGDGDFWLLGRVDDVMNVSGHRISTIEVESALVDHPAVAEAAVCGRADALTGQAIVAFVTLKSGLEGSVEMLEELRNHVATVIGPIAKPANVLFTPELPKTRSGKIMRRLLRDVAENRPLGDTTTLADPAVVEEIRERSATGSSADE